MDGRRSMVGVRCEPELRAEFKAEAERRGISEATMLREAGKAWMRLRNRYGPHLESQIAVWLGEAPAFDGRTERAA